MNKETYTSKNLFGGSQFQGFKLAAIRNEFMLAGRHTTGTVAERLHLIQKHKTERQKLTENGMGV